MVDGVDRGGLNYPIRVVDEFSETTSLFSSEINRVKKEFSDFQRSVGATSINLKVFTDAADGNDRITAALRRRKKAEEEVAGFLDAQNGPAVRQAAAEREQIEDRVTRAIRQAAIERRRIAREEAADRLRDARESGRIAEQAEKFRLKLSDEAFKRKQDQARRGILPTGQDSDFRDVGRQTNALRAETQARAEDTKRTADAFRQAARDAKEAEKQTGFFDKGVARLIKTVLVLQAIRLGQQFVRDLFGTVFEFNRQLEDTKLGIASILTAVGDVQDATGRSVSAGQRLALGQKEAARQTELLRQEALKTSGTFEDLAKAFEQALGPGLTSGLNVDQVRQFTVQISQAASALGVASNQLSEEIRSILAGTIQARTTRIASALGITNADIQRAKDAGVLADFLNQKFQAFNQAAEAGVNNFTRIIANLKDAFEQVLGSAGVGLFEQIKKTAQEIQKALLVKGDDGILRPRPEIVAQFKTILDTVRDLVKAVDSLNSSFSFTNKIINGLGAAFAGLKTILLAGVAGVLEALRLLPDGILKFLGTSGKEIEAAQFSLLADMEGSAKKTAEFLKNGGFAAKGDIKVAVDAILGPTKAVKEEFKSLSQAVEDLPGNFGRAGPELDQFRETLKKMKEESERADKALRLAEAGATKLAARGAKGGKGAKEGLAGGGNTSIDDADAQARAKIEVENEIAREKALEQPLKVRQGLQSALNDLLRQEQILRKNDAGRDQEKVALEEKAVQEAQALHGLNNDIGRAKDDILEKERLIAKARKEGDAEGAAALEAEKAKIEEFKGFFEGLAAESKAKLDAFEAAGASNEVVLKKVSILGEINSIQKDINEADLISLEINAALTKDKEKQLEAERLRKIAALPSQGTGGGGGSGNLSGSVAKETSAILTNPVFNAGLEGISNLFAKAFDPNSPDKGLNRKFKDFFNDILKNVPLFLFSILTGAPIPGLTAKASGTGLAEGGVVPGSAQASLAHARARGYFGGGGIRPAGLPSSDTVPIWATPGEVMMRLAAVSRYGEDTLLRINAGMADPMALRLAAGSSPIPGSARAPKVGFATGGRVGELPVSSGGGTSVLPVLTTTPDNMARMIAGGQAAFDRAVDERIRRAGGRR